MEVTLKQLIAWLKTWGACQSVIDWLEGLPPDTTIRAVWETCPVGDWAIWMLKRLGADSRRLTRVACRIIRKAPIANERTIWDLLTDPRSQNAVKVAELWAHYEESDEELEAAASDARDALIALASLAAHSARAALAAYVSRAPLDAYAALAACAFSDARTAFAASVACDARTAFAVLDACDASAAAQQFAADIVREEFTFEEVEALWQG